MNTSKIKLVVIDGHTLGYIHPLTPNMYSVLSASILKGASCNDRMPAPKSLLFINTVRLASEKDFNDFRVSFDGYKNNPQEYEYQQTK